MNKLPYPHFMDVTPITVTLTNGIEESGAEKTVTTVNTFCYFEENVETSRDVDGIKHKLKGKAIMGRDVSALVKTIKGSVSVNGVTYKILTGSRFNNPDGTVHHTELELV